MPFLNFIFQPKNELESGGLSVAPVQSDASEPEKNCPNCHRDIPISTLWSNYNTCPCGYHFRMSARQRLHYLTDRESFTSCLRTSSPATRSAFRTTRRRSRRSGPRAKRRRPLSAARAASAAIPAPCS